MSARESLLSPDWYRVARLRPRLRSSIGVSRQVVRGATWHVLTDKTSGRHYRFNDIAYRFIASFDGAQTVDAVWAARVDAEGEHAPTQGDVIRVLSQAYGANLLVGDFSPEVENMVRAGERRRSARRLGAINPLAFRVPVCDPERFLRATVAVVRPLVGTVSAGVAFALGMLGLGLWLIHAEAIQRFAATHLDTVRMLVVMGVTYPIMKLVHELAHAYTLKAGGGEVHEMGVTLFLLMPVPYVDASSSSAFADKGRRIGVALAGILTELALAGVALIAWLVTEPGLVNDIAFAVALIGGVSTLLVNGNPLVRFDGYYALCDACELPNLAVRSARFWQAWAKRLALGVRSVELTEPQRGERLWLVVYAPASWLYRVLLFSGIALLVAGIHGGLGLVVAAMAVLNLLLKPLWRMVGYVSGAHELAGRRVRAGLIVGGLLAAIAVGAFGLPLPHLTYAQGVLWLPDRAFVRPEVEGFVAELLVRDGDRVAIGTPVARLENDPIQVELERVTAQIKRADVDRAAFQTVDALKTALAGDELARLRAEQERLLERIGALTVRANEAGTIVIDRAVDLPGRFVQQGQTIGHVLAPTTAWVRVLVRNEDVALVRAQPGEIAVVPVHAPHQQYRAELAGELPQSGLALPSAALGDAGGGSVPVDPADTSGRTAREPRFQFDLRVLDPIESRIGARVRVAFRHGEATLAQQAWNFVQKTFLRHFEH